MRFLLVITPIITAFIGWLIHTLFIKAMISSLLKRRESLAASLANMVTEKFFSFDQIEEQITDPVNIEKVLPEVEAHIDHFLRVKLSSTMPMISMFIGDKTITQLKQVFMAELQELFPSVLRNYVQNLKKDVDLEKTIAAKLATIDEAAFEADLRKLLAPQLRLVQQVGALTGFIAGMVAMVLFMIATRP